MTKTKLGPYFFLHFYRFRAFLYLGTNIGFLNLTKIIL